MKDLTELVKLSLEGNEEAFKSLFDISHKTIYFKVNKIVMDEQSSMDILQNTYIKAYKKLSSLQEPKAFLKWLNVIATNETKDYLRKRKDINLSALDSEDGELEFEIEDESLEYRPDAQADLEETRDIINSIILKLPEAQRAVIMMYYFEELQISEIASILEISDNTVKSRMRYAKQSIENDVLELEKTSDIKLYGFAPIAFFAWYLKSAGSAPSLPPLSVPLIETVSSINTATSVATSTATTGVSKAIAFLTPTTTLGKVVATTVVSGTLAVSAIAGFSALNQDDKKNAPKKETPVVDVIDNEKNEEKIDDEDILSEESPKDEKPVEEKPVEEKPKNDVEDNKPAKYQPTAQELKAVAEIDAMYVEYKAGPAWLISQDYVRSVLKNNGFNDKEIQYGLNNSIFDWDAEYIRAAKYFQAIMPKSYKGLINDLSTYHPKEKAIFAAANIGVDWDRHALYFAKHYESDPAYNRLMLYNLLSGPGEYSAAEIDLVKREYKLDWSQKAVTFADYIINKEGLEGLEAKMTEHLFTPQEITYAKNQLGI